MCPLGGSLATLKYRSWWQTVALEAVVDRLAAETHSLADLHTATYLTRLRWFHNAYSNCNPLIRLQRFDLHDMQCMTRSG